MHALAPGRIRGIVFDLWNTLVYNDHRPNPIVALGAAFGLLGTRGWIKFIERSMMLRPMAGIEEGIASLSRELKLTLPDGEADGLSRLWRQACLQTRLFPDVAEALSRLGEEYRLGLLSNTQSFDLQFLDDPLLAPVSSVRLLSCHTGLLKPDPALFLRMAGMLRLDPSEILMIGDNLQDDVFGSESVGMQGVLIRRHEAPLSFQERHPDRTPIQTLPGLLEALGL